jgi:hypothetical protein
MKRSPILLTRRKGPVSWSNPLRLLIAAAILHLLVATAVFTLGRQALLSGTFDSNGIAVSFASDGVGHREDAATLGEILWSGNLHDWFSAAYPFHVKLYSICFAVFGAFLGFNILAVEPLNLFYYVGILILVYKLGSEIFGSRAALIASGIVALWPSFVLHTTQLLKDPLFILGMLTLIFLMMRLLTRPCSWRKALLHSVVGASIAAVLWKVRSDMGAVLIASVLLGAVMLLLRQFQLSRVLASNLAGMALLIVLTAAAMLWLPAYRDEENPRVKEAASRAAHIRRGVKPKPVVRWWQVPAKIGIVREQFAAKYPDARSNIETDVKLATNADLIRYLPRATEIGLLAPFPNMWFDMGSSVGSMGRMLSGLETLLMYAVEALGVVGLWQGRRQLSAWLLFSIAAMGTIALGLVMVNVGTLYRLRYLFLILLIILAAGGITHLFDWFMKKRSQRLISTAL